MKNKKAQGIPNLTMENILLYVLAVIFAGIVFYALYFFIEKMFN